MYTLFFVSTCRYVTSTFKQSSFIIFPPYPGNATTYTLLSHNMDSVNFLQNRTFTHQVLINFSLYDTSTYKLNSPSLYSQSPHSPGSQLMLLHSLGTLIFQRFFDVQGKTLNFKRGTSMEAAKFRQVF